MAHVTCILVILGLSEFSCYIPDSWSWPDAWFLDKWGMAEYEYTAVVHSYIFAYSIS